MEPRHHRAHRYLEGRGDVPVRHLLDVEEDDGHSRPLVQVVERSLETGKLLPQGGLALGTWRRGGGDRQFLHPGHHLPPPEQVQAEPPCDGDEPGQDRALRIEPLEVDEGAHERVLGEILGVGRSDQSPAEPVDRPVKAPDQLVESRRVAAAGATRQLDLCSPGFRIRAWGCCMTGLYDRTLLPSPKRVRTMPQGYFRHRTPRASGPPKRVLVSAGHARRRGWRRRGRRGTRRAESGRSLGRWRPPSRGLRGSRLSRAGRRRRRRWRRAPAPASAAAWRRAPWPGPALRG